MERLPLDARSIVDELRSAPRPPSGNGPRYWVPSAAFQALLVEADTAPVALNDHLAWLHENSDLSPLLAPPTGTGLRSWAKRLVHRAVLAAFAPYLVRVQDCIAVTVRAIDTVARRVDEQAATQLRAVEAMRSDLVDFATQLEERLEE